MREVKNILSALSIRHKVLLVVMVTCGAAIFVTFGMFMLYNSISMRNAMVEEIKVLGEVIGNRSTAALIYNDEKTASENLEAFRAKESIVKACIYDNYDKEFASYHRESKNFLSKNLFCPENLKKGYYFEDDGLYLYQDIILTDEKIGTIYILSDLDSVHENFVQYTTYALLSIIAGAFFAYMISSKLLGVVFNPVVHLVEVAKAVSENYNYSVRAKKTTNDELGLLVEAFNNMLQQIHSRDKEVLATKESLEMRVVRRTQDLEEAKKFAEEANRAKSMFLANMSHELRTPMHAVLSYSDFGMEEINEASPEELHKYFSRIYDSGVRLLSLLNNLLDLSKLESNKVDFNFEKGDLRKPINTVVQELQKLLEEKRLTLKVMKPEFEPYAFFDSGKIIQVVYNILSNAIRYSPNEGTITINFNKGSTPVNEQNKKTIDVVFVSICNQGISIPEDELETIFDKFIQSSKTVTGAGGTGLGLAICTEIMNAHSGKIWCKNKEKEGVIFTFFLPIEET